MESYSNNQTEHSLLDILILVWVSSFFVFVILTLYPQISFVPGLDMVRHLSSAQKLLVAPDTYGTEEPWFHFTYAVVNLLSAPSMWVFQSGIAFLSIVLILSFYTMAKSYLIDIDKRAHVLATAFFSVFSGFGWLYIAGKKFSLLTPNDYINTLLASTNISFFDLSRGQSSWLWAEFRPITIGFTIFFILLYLMKREDLNRTSYIIITSLLVLTLGQVHPSELIIFVALLLVVSLVRPTIKLRLMETGISVIIAIIFSSVINESYRLILSEGVHPLSTNYMPILAALSGASCLLVRYHKRPKIHFRFNLTLLIPILLFVYFVLVFLWFSNADSYSVEWLATFQPVPWEFYPVLLGVVGAISIPGIFLIAKNYRNHPIVIFVVIFVLAIIIGKFITYVNANLFFTDYYERRLIPLVFVASSILASLVLVSIGKQEYKKKRLKAIKNIVTVIFLSSLVLTGTLSTILAVEHRSFFTPKNAISVTEKRFQSSLDNVDPRSILITVTNRSRDLAQYENIGYIIETSKDQMWASKSPELPLKLLSLLNSPSILFLSPRDMKIIQSQYSDGYIASHLVNAAPVLFKGIEGQTLQVPPLVSTSSHSNVTLVLPEKQNEAYYAYDILSLGHYNYTTASLWDLNSIGKAKIIVTPNEEVTLKLMEFKERFNLQFEKLIVLDPEPSGSLVGVKYTTSNAFILAGNDSSKQWIPDANSNENVGNGSIGIPILRDSAISNSGNRALEISVGQGKYLWWKISRIFDEPKDFSKFDVVKFNWYGKNDGKFYVADFTSANGKDFWYRFQDSWEGWKQVILPLGIPDVTNQQVVGVPLTKVTALGASWTDIKRIEIRTESSNVNHGGTFYLNGFAFDNTLKSSSIIEVSSNKIIQLPTNLNINQILLQSDYDTIAYYDVGIPFILHKTYLGYDMFYVNLNPIVQNLNSPENNISSVFPYLGRLLELTNVKLPIAESGGTHLFSYGAGGVSAFTNATIIGNITLTSSSALINTNSTSVKVIIDGNNFLFNNISKIAPVRIDNVTVKSEGGVIGGGYGFYSHALLNNSSIEFNGTPATLLLIYTNGSSSTITGKEIQINLADPDIFLREPTVTANGETKFHNLYALGDIGKKLQVSSENLIIEGQVAFKNKYSDEFTVANDTSFKGNLVRMKPLIPFNELGTFSNIFDPSYLPYPLVIGLIDIIISVLVLYRKIIIPKLRK
ncbi:MAG: hypothetical protein ACRD9Q_06605 [Nitrososphaeraceae archaeon]